MPYDQYGKWKAPYGASCNICNNLGYVLTVENGIQYAWKCGCDIGRERNLNYPLHR